VGLKELNSITASQDRRSVDTKKGIIVRSVRLSIKRLFAQAQKEIVNISNTLPQKEVNWPNGHDHGR